MSSREPPTGRRADLAALIEPIRRALLHTEIEVLGGLGLSMWAYVVLLNLTAKPIRTQAALADAIGADRTRIIAVLDDLQERDLISRRPDPDDRRVRLLALTETGEALRRAAQSAIQRREEGLLSVLAPGVRAGFLTALQQLSNDTALARLDERTEREPDERTEGAGRGVDG
jgi:DNA-binding MarR family transcriptional regulator